MPAFPPSTTVFDSFLFRDAFGTPAMREVLSDFRLISRYAEAEIALARAEARCGVIPAEAADEIARRTDVAEKPSRPCAADSRSRASGVQALKDRAE